MPRSSLYAILALLAWLLPGMARPAEGDVALYLIGDAGAPDADGDPVLRALHEELARQSVPSMVVFLGDNAYPAGLADVASDERAETERRLEAQIDVVRGTAARAIFVPGNHDWDNGGDDGWEAMRRQTALIDSVSDAQVDILPKNGCPGPEVVDVGQRLRLVMIDTQWWLHSGPKPQGAQGGCAQPDGTAALGALEQMVRAAGGRHVVVIAHHPLQSGGRHGGHFTWKQHIFPLTEAVSWLWIPLPIIGSAYPLVRGAWSADQDLGGDSYAELRASLDSTLERAGRPLLYAAGHEHNLQVLKSVGARFHVVSGTGMYDHSTQVVELDETIFASEDAGYMRVDLGADGGAHLTVVAVDGEAATREVFETWLEKP